MAEPFGGLDPEKLSAQGSGLPMPGVVNNPYFDSGGQSPLLDVARKATGSEDQVGRLLFALSGEQRAPTAIEEMRQRRTGSVQSKQAQRMAQLEWSALLRAGADPNHPLTADQFGEAVTQFQEKYAMFSMPNPVQLYEAESEQDNPELKLANARSRLQESLGDAWTPKYESMIKLTKDGDLDYGDYHREREIELRFTENERKVELEKQKSLVEAKEKQFEMIRDGILSSVSPVKEGEGGFLGFGGMSAEEASAQNRQAQLDASRRVTEAHKAMFPELYPDAQSPVTAPTGDPRVAAQELGVQYIPSPEEAERLYREGAIKPGDRIVDWTGKVKVAQ